MTSWSPGHSEVDTCYVYGDTTCEQMLGDLAAADRFSVAIRFDPLATPHGHEPEILIANVRASLQRLRTDRVQVLYLNARDSATPLVETMSAVQQLHQEGVFDEFGLSNVAASDVAAYVAAAKHHVWIRPTVYQGLCNAISRAAEIELLPELRRHGVRFHAYNPLAGGAFAAGFGHADSVQDGSRFDDKHQQGQGYRARYWNDSYLAGLAMVQQACLAAEIAPTEAALRWLVHHSALEHSHGHRPRGLRLPGRPGRQSPAQCRSLRRGAPGPGRATSARDRAESGASEVECETSEALLFALFFKRQ